jgi:hypothetical protein
VHALLASAAPSHRANAEPHPAFRRSLAAFARLGAAVRADGVWLPPHGGLPDAHPTYRAIAAALRDASAGARPLLEDASLLERASYELGLFARLLRPAPPGEPPAPPAEDDPAETAFATAPAVRLVYTRWDWDAFLADPTQDDPAEHGAAWVLYLPPSGPVQFRRLHSLPAMVLEACAGPRTRHAAAMAVAEQVEGDPARIAAMVHAQMDELSASGLLRPFAPTAAGHAVSEMRRLLPAAQTHEPAASSLLAVLSRAVRPTRQAADEALRAADAGYPVHRLDLSVGALEQILARSRLRDAFSTELDGYWAAAGVASRVAWLSPLLEVLRRVVGTGVHALPPYAVSP